MSGKFTIVVSGHCNKSFFVTSAMALLSSSDFLFQMLFISTSDTRLHQRVIELHLWESHAQNIYYHKNIASTDFLTIETHNECLVSVFFLRVILNDSVCKDHIHRVLLKRKQGFTNLHFWIRGCCVSTVGLDEENV